MYIRIYKNDLLPRPLYQGRSALITLVLPCIALLSTLVLTYEKNDFTIDLKL